MKRILLGIILTLLGLLIYKSCADQKNQKNTELVGQQLIREKLAHISKLQVSEGYFSEVFTYKDSKSVFGPYLVADKKALVVVNAKVTLGFDLKSMEYTLDSVHKTIFIQKIPKPEIDINPKIQYYDLQADFFNPFEANDYNQIREKVENLILQKVQASSMISNAENRLISELSQLFFLSKSLGWTLTYEGVILNEEQGINRILRP